MDGWLGDLEAHWIWLALGVILGTVEMLVPGYFMIWLAAAAILTGLATLLFPLGEPLQIALFALLSVNSVLLARRWLRINPIESPDPLLNDRVGRLVGETVVVTHAIDGGRGRVRHGDSEWLARGPDTPTGVRMRIAGSDGAILIVEPLGQAHIGPPQPTSGTPDNA